MRLLIPERPERRHMRIAGYLSPRAHQVYRRIGQDNEDVSGWGLLRGQKNPLRAPQIEGARWMSKEDSPALGSNHPGDGDACSVGGEVGTYLSVPHCIRGASPIQRMTSLAKTKDRAVAKVEVNRA